MIKIKKGHHYDNNWLSTLPTFKKRIERTHTFTESCRYCITDENQADINKLFGICFGNVHKDSARIGWRTVISSSKIEIFAYCYVNGKRKAEHICFVNINETVAYSIKVTDTDYIFTVERLAYYKPIFSARIAKQKTAHLGWTLGAYFGGDETAPHDIIIN